MAAVVADLALESEAATALAMRLAAAVDAGEQALLRIALPASKYYVCKRAPAVVAEALECLGGNGYIEDSGLPRLYREAPLNSIWEGPGNVTALDVLRGLSRNAASAEALLAELDPVARAYPGLDRAVGLLRVELSDPVPERARRLAVLIALCLQASLLVQHSPAVVAEAFLGSRFGDDGTGWTLGLLPARTDIRLLVERVTPSVGMTAPQPGSASSS
jgi:putative acyl-CoA dehydrogenase